MSAFTVREALCGVTPNVEVNPDFRLPRQQEVALAMVAVMLNHGDLDDESDVLDMTPAQLVKSLK